MENSWFEYDRDALKIGIIMPKKLPLVITKDDVEISYFSGGPGGQNVNRSMNGVRLIYRIPEKNQISFKKTKELIAKCMRQRSREQNFKEAFDILAQKIEQYFYIQPFREKTKVPRSSKRKRIEGKKRKGQIKEGRKRAEVDA